ncbi:YqxA family protein [Siminovitchia fortis]|uniref:YqxA family protein n=1 Tax=Siminovitchia fortis TaxID=254758 RepID=UPI00119E27D7|nr:YqxA family protein [Siminovitchia fortis]
MVKFMLKFLLLAIVLFVGVFIGMEKAHQGMQGMKGYEDTALPPPVHISESEDGKIEAAFLGNEIDHAEELAKKKKELEDIETYNFFSSMGKALSSFVKETAKFLIDFIMNLFKG